MSARFPRPAPQQTPQRPVALARALRRTPLPLLDLGLLCLGALMLMVL